MPYSPPNPFGSIQALIGVGQTINRKTNTYARLENWSEKMLIRFLTGLFVLVIGLMSAVPIRPAQQSLRVYCRPRRGILAQYL